MHGAYPASFIASLGSALSANPAEGSGLIDRAVRVPHIHQRADGEIPQLSAAFQPGFNLGALLFAYRATLGQAYQTVVVAAHIAQAIGGHGVTQELIEERIHDFFSQIVLEVQVQLKTQLLEFIHAEFFAQTAGTVSSHGTILKSDNAAHSSSFAARTPAPQPGGRPNEASTDCTPIAAKATPTPSHQEKPAL